MRGLFACGFIRSITPPAPSDALRVEALNSRMIKHSAKRYLKALVLQPQLERLSINRKRPHGAWAFTAWTGVFEDQERADDPFGRKAIPGDHIRRVAGYRRAAFYDFAQPIL